MTGGQTCALPIFFFTTDWVDAELLRRKNLLSPHVSPLTEGVPAEFRAADGAWTGVIARSRNILINTNLVKREDYPASVFDLADPKWKGKVAASTLRDGVPIWLASLILLKGEAATANWLKGMKANSTALRGNGAVLRAVNAGETEGGVIYHYYYFQDQARTGENSKNVGMHFFRNQDPGAFVSVSGGGVLASSRNQAEAQRFLRFIVGKGGQDILKTGDAMEYAVATGADSHPKLPPINSLDAPKLDPAKLTSKKVTELMMAAGLL